MNSAGHYIKHLWSSFKTGYDNKLREHKWLPVRLAASVMWYVILGLGAAVLLVCLLYFVGYVIYGWNVLFTWLAGANPFANGVPVFYGLATIFMPIITFVATGFGLYDFFKGEDKIVKKKQQMIDDMLGNNKKKSSIW